jgi:hypothetical protein
VLDVSASVFLTQRSITRKTNEIGMFAEVMDQIESLDGVLAAADAMGCQTGHVTYLDGRGAGLLVGLKRNQPTTFDQAAALPWDQIPVADVEVTPRLHGRVDKRVVKVTSIGRDDNEITFPGARQVAQVTRYQQRRTRTPGRWYWKKIEVAYYLCTWDQIRLPAPLTCIVFPSQGGTGWGLRACSILRLSLVPGRFCDRAGVSGVAQRSRSDGPAGVALDRHARERMLGPARGKPVGEVNMCAVEAGWSCPGGVTCQVHERECWTDGRSRLGNHAYLGARTRPCWSGHMMMMGSLLPGWDSRSAGARPFKLPRPPRDTVPALQEPGRRSDSGVAGTSRSAHRLAYRALLVLP